MPTKPVDVSEILEINSSRPVCKPLDSLYEIMLFLENPPPWRTLCKELTPHSDYAIRNSDINTRPGSLTNPEVFCHYELESEEVKRHVSKSLPKILVCHDMANGYHDDCIIEGTPNSEAYTFYNWAGIDIFCYFSHHLITIPPISWINVGHAHGVKVIGTLITEHTEGAMFWEEVLSSESEYQNLASALVAIAKTFKFDGYLLNIENKVALPDVLLSFVTYFHRQLHEELPHAILLWYDSVTINGKLHWQNSLNEKNKAYFDACDGLFTNYSWTPEDVASSAAVAADRLTDLYIGIDVWGRNFHGGGQFNTREAIEVAHAAGCSIAVFAPAWTHEAISCDRSAGNDVAMADELHDYDKFLLRDRALWGTLWSFFNTKLPCHLPFKTSFCRGQGCKRYSYGEVLSPSPWFNLRHQQYQPNAAHGPHGYLLSTIDRLDKVKQEYKEKKGIMRIRSSFMVNEVPVEASLTSQEPMEPVSLAPQKPSAEKLSIEIANEIVDEQELTNDVIPEQPSVSMRLGRKDKPRWGLALVANERPCLELHLADAFTGGSCLMVHPSDRLNPDHRIMRLFHCDFRCDEGLIFCVVTKKLSGHPEQTLNVKLSMRNSSNEELAVVLSGRPLKAQASQLGARAAGIHYVYPLCASREELLRDLRSYLLVTQPSFYVPIDNAFGWDVRYYEISVPGSRISAVNLRTGLADGPILLGHFGIAQKSCDMSSMMKLGSTVAPAGPNNPVAPADPNNPVAPAGPNNPVAPAGPDNPVAAVGPNNPVTLAGPNSPVIFAGPKNPITPASQNKPFAPVKDLVAPVHPNNPVAPLVVRTNDPVTLAGPNDPVTLAGTNSPVTFAGPKNSVTPASQNKPVAPVKDLVAPVHPNNPVAPLVVRTSDPVTLAGPNDPVTLAGTNSRVTFASPNNPVTPASQNKPVAPVKDLVAPVHPNNAVAPLVVRTNDPVTLAGPNDPVTAAGQSIPPLFALTDPCVAQ